MVFEFRLSINRSIRIVSGMSLVFTADNSFFFWGGGSEFRCTSLSKLFRLFYDPALVMCAAADVSKIVKTIGGNRRRPATCPEREEKRRRRLSDRD